MCVKREILPLQRIFHLSIPKMTKPTKLVNLCLPVLELKQTIFFKRLVNLSWSFTQRIWLLWLQINNIVSAHSSLTQVPSFLSCRQNRMWWTKNACTLRTDTRHTQGSSTPVRALAFILQMKENLFLQRTQLACTGSLGEEHIGNKTFVTLSTERANIHHK